MKYFVKKSSYEQLCKSLGNSRLEALKKEVIAILEKKDNEEMKKAIEYFEATEWIEKSTYGVGTVRVWRGKKYKKVSTSPARWVRVFDKIDRGAKSSMTRLIHKVQACNSVEELYQFCLSNHSLFKDDNGVDLPIMDKLRSAIDKQSGLLEGSRNIKDAPKADNEKKQNEKDSKVLSNGKTVNDENNFSRILSDKQLLNSIDRKRNKLSTPGKDVTPIEEELKNVSEKLKNMNNKELNDIFDNFETDYTKYPSIGEFEDELEERLKTFDIVYDRLSNNNKKEELDKRNDIYWIQDSKGNRITNEDAKKKIKSNYEKLLEIGLNENEPRAEIRVKELNDEDDFLMERLNPDDKKEMENERYKFINTLSEKKEEKKKKELNMSDAEINSLTDIDYLKDLQKKVVKENNRLFSEKRYDEANDMARRSDVIFYRIKQLESEAKKHQNRSDAMKGNQNAYKGRC